MLEEGILFAPLFSIPFLLSIIAIDFGDFDSPLQLQLEGIVCVSISLQLSMDFLFMVYSLLRSNDYGVLLSDEVNFH